MNMMETELGNGWIALQVKKKKKTEGKKKGGGEKSPLQIHVSVS